MATVIERLVKMSVAVGSDGRFVQGGGGNTSAKSSDGRLLVKASGTSLSEMSKEAGFRELDLQEVRSILDDEALAKLPTTQREEEVVVRLKAACLDERPGRPSVESGLHALLGRYVVHTHPALVNGLLCAKEGAAALGRVMKRLKLTWLLIPYCDPGFPLARTMKERLAEYEAEHGDLPQVLLLENHGMFTAGDTPEEALERTHAVYESVERVIRRARGKSKPGPAPSEEMVRACRAGVRRHLAARAGGPGLLRLVEDDAVRELMGREDARSLVKTGALMPDQIVYLGEKLVWVQGERDASKAADRVAARLARMKTEGLSAFAVEGVGVFVAAKDLKGLRTNEAVMVTVARMLLVGSAFGGVRALTPRATRYIAKWEAEAFRRQVAGAGGEGPLAGQVAVVTGGGSGIGRGVAIGVARAGAHVVLADIDEKAAEETRELIQEQCGQDRALVVGTDVTCEESVADMVSRAVGYFGGVDLLVNAAGIAPSAKLVNFPLAAWRKTLEINLTGYFLVAREAARQMALQGSGGSIVNISSKSGLEASKNHSAYNATKAGEIHLARGWALELAAHKVRVNAVCPGNVFSGSKIWNPDYIRSLAKKRGLKPEEVIPYYIGLSALKEEITADDIADAVIFLSSEAASKITGQTLVVDAGQVFVR
jgi:NAD(P)-dependent dehydrogenase (short-subunit alcohol dehydrogenase family)/rhamnose utilization protein RhaD (predicted bifunctional aldolase and dehydrogenase)